MHSIVSGGREKSMGEMRVTGEGLVRLVRYGWGCAQTASRLVNSRWKPEASARDLACIPGKSGFAGRAGSLADASGYQRADRQARWADPLMLLQCGALAEAVGYAALG